MGEIDEEDETYEDEGKEWVEDNWYYIFYYISYGEHWGYEIK